jgi:WD40 repeat protein
LRTDVPGLALLALSKDGNYLWGVTGSPDTARLWNIESGQCVVSIDGHIFDAKEAVGGRVAVVPLSRGNDHETVFYDLAHPERAPRRVPDRRVKRMAVSPDGGLVHPPPRAVWCACLIPPERGIKTPWPPGIAFGVAFSPDGRRLISASGGREAVKLWDVSTRQGC